MSAEFDPLRMVEVLGRHQVDYILVGGYAAQLHGARRPTYDIDITPSTGAENLDRLAHALRELGAGIRVDNVDEALPFSCTAESLRGIEMLNLRTTAGDLDLTFKPAGFENGYADMLPNILSRKVGTIVVQVADLPDVIKSKSAAARPKDLDALPELLKIERGRSRRRNAPTRHQDDDLEHGLDL